LCFDSRKTGILQKYKVLIAKKLEKLRNTVENSQYVRKETTEKNIENCRKLSLITKKIEKKLINNKIRKL